jgi:N-acyl-D-aspartate/D-glutamate deacylase
LLDVLIENSQVIDGTGGPWFRASVGVRGDRIRYLGSGHPEAKKRIRGSRLFLSPGFIDIHSHSDFTLIVEPKGESKVKQGVTTEVIGNCGLSPAPVTEAGKQALLEWELMEAIELGLVKSKKIKWNWNSVEQYSNLLNRKGVGVNVAPVIGHGCLRVIAMGQAKRAANRHEMAFMRKLLSEGMKEGAFGLSSGLAYPPASYAREKELVELCSIVGRYGGFYMSHIRNEGDRLLQAVREAIAIGSKSGVPVQISHMKATGRRNWGKPRKVLEIMRNARKRGIDVTGDQYPYEAVSLSAMYLIDFLPNWLRKIVHMNDLSALDSYETKKRMRRDLREGLGWYLNGKRVFDHPWDETFIVDAPSLRKYEGKTFAELSKLVNKEPVDILRGLLLKRSRIQILPRSMCEDDIQTILRDEMVMIGSDGWALQRKGVCSRAARTKLHPRNYGTFPRVIHRYVRETGLLTLEDAIRKMTSATARKVGLFDRGIIAEGMVADIVLFDLGQLRDTATFARPEVYAKGVEYVLVNGEVAVAGGKHTGILAGKVLRHAGFAN